jgi:hypothetical protein
MEERVAPEAMRLRRQTVEHPFATIKYRILGHPRLLVPGVTGARSEIAIATMAYNLKHITKGTRCLRYPVERSSLELLACLSLHRLPYTVSAIYLATVCAILVASSP